MTTPRPTPAQLTAAFDALLGPDWKLMSYGTTYSASKFIETQDPMWIAALAVGMDWDAMLPAPDLEAVGVVLRALEYIQIESGEGDDGPLLWFYKGHVECGLAPNGWMLTMSGDVFAEMRWPDPGAIPALLCTIAGLSRGAAKGEGA